MNFSLVLKHKLYLIIAALPLAAIIYFFPVSKTLDLNGLDALMMQHVPDPDIALIAIDNKSIAELGRWPWKRSLHARVLDILDSYYHPRSVSYDVTFSETENEIEDKTFAASIKNSKFPIVFAGELIVLKNNQKGYEELIPIESFRSYKNVFVGYVNVEPSLDGLARLLSGSVRIGDKNFISFAYQTAAASGNKSKEPTATRMVNFSGPAGTFPTYSLADVLKKQIPENFLKNKIIIIGATASDLHDILMVPFSSSLMAGIEWHANAIDNILLSRSIYIVPEYIPKLIGLLLTLSLIVFSFKISVKKLLGITIALMIFYILSSYIFWQNNIAVIYASNFILTAGAFTELSLVRWYWAEKEKKKLRERFQNYFSPNVMEAIIKNPSHLALGGECREVTIFFSDIRSFTTMTEHTDSEVLIKILHRYFTEMSYEIFETDGVLDKFIGDAIMAFWGAPLEHPNHPERAVRAAIGMMKRLSKLHEDFKKEGWPVFDIGIGIHTGLATVGNMGSVKRFDYTIIGDAVNLASRLESLNKEYKTHIIISEETEKHLSADIQRRSLGEVTVKGKTVPTKIFEVLGY